jgi:ketosteroid isomerase-like protein
VARVAAEHPSVALARRFFNAFAERDGRVVAAVLDDDVVWRVGGTSGMAGEYRGRREVVAFLGRTTALTDGTYRSELLYAVADDEHLVIVYRARGERGERSIDLQQLLLCKVQDGRLADVTAVPTDQRAFDAFWS